MQVAEAVLAHRIILDRKAAGAGETAHTVLQGILSRLPVPQAPAGAGNTRVQARRRNPEPGRPECRVRGRFGQEPLGGTPWPSWTDCPSTSSPPGGGACWLPAGFTLAAAQIMGRRDLLTLSILLLVLPLVSLAGIRLVKPRFQVYREFHPSPVETSSPTTVRLAVARTGAGSGRATMEERLPPRFGESPAFRFPVAYGLRRHQPLRIPPAFGAARPVPHWPGHGRVHGPLRPVAAPPGHRRRRHLTVTPAAVVLPATGLAGARGNDGVTATRIRANPSDDDVMTREYRHGDPMRRVHWAATARHGSLMVRQEESVTTPEATIILDHRFGAFSSGSTAAAGQAGQASQDGHSMLTSDTFEWSVVAAMSISAHLAERNYVPALPGCPGRARLPALAVGAGTGGRGIRRRAGLQSIAESLAAIQLTGPHHARTSGRFRPSSGPDSAAALLRPRSRNGQDAGPAAFDDRLMDKLSAHRMRGPLIAVLGRISPEEARPGPGRRLRHQCLCRHRG